METLEREVNQLHSELCAGLADPKRLLILYALSQGALNVSEISDERISIFDGALKAWAVEMELISSFMHAVIRGSHTSEEA